MKAVREITICNATLMWTNPSSVPRKKYILFSISGVKTEKDHFVNATDDEDCGLAQIARLLANAISTIDKIPEIVFKPEIDSFTVYRDGFFGRPVIPANVWALKPLKRRQKVELSKRLLKLGVSSDSIIRLKLPSRIR